LDPSPVLSTVFLDVASVRHGHRLVEHGDMMGHGCRFSDELYCSSDVWCTLYIAVVVCVVRRLLYYLLAGLINQDCIPDYVQTGLYNRSLHLPNLALLFVI
jgi:hypothetical protein